MLLMPKRERATAFIVGGALLASLAAAATYDKGRLHTDYFSSDSMTVFTV